MEDLKNEAVSDTSGTSYCLDDISQIGLFGPSVF